MMKLPSSLACVVFPEQMSHIHVLQKYEAVINLENHVIGLKCNSTIVHRHIQATLSAHRVMNCTLLEQNADRCRIDGTQMDTCRCV